MNSAINAGSPPPPQLDRQSADGTASFHLSTKHGYFRRLRRHIDAWRRIGASQEVLSWIEHGYRIPFRERPNPCRMRNHMDQNHPQAWFVDQVLREMINAEAVKEVSSKDCTVVSPLNVAPKKGINKWRLILDLRYCNTFCDVDSFTMQTLAKSRDMFSRGDLLMGLDLANGYFHQDIHESDWQYLSFKWTFQGEKEPRFMQFRVLPFGGNFAPSCFEKLMGTVAAYLRSRGIKVLQYLDDAGFSFPPGTAEAQRRFVLKTFDDLGLVLNLKKSTAASLDEPLVQRLKLLGTWVDTATGSFEIDPDRLEEVLSIAQRLRKVRRFPAKDLARFVGKVCSFSLVLGKVTWLYTRHLFFAINSRRNWAASVDIDSIGCRRELDFLFSQLEHHKRSSIWIKELTAHDLLVYSDAGAEATGAHMDLGPVTLLTRQDGDAAYDEESSAAREIEAGLRALRAFWRHLAGKRVRFRMDAKAAVQALTKGASKKQNCHDRIVQFYELCWKNEIEPSFEWIPREDNVCADEQSKTFDASDARFSPALFRRLERLWGAHTVDLFANIANVQRSGPDRSPLPFHSYWHYDNSRGDAFATRWTRDVWAFPPFVVIGQTIRHAGACGASGSIILPFSQRPSDHWWPLVCEFTADPRYPNWAPWVHEVVRLPSNAITSYGRHAKRITQPLIAVKFDFSSGRHSRNPKFHDWRARRA